MKKLALAIVIIAAAAGAYFALSGSKEAKTLGKPIAPDAKAISISEAVRMAGKDSKDVVVKGQITEKCPTSGCWFYLKDDTGSIRVDAQFSGFNVLDVPSGSQVTLQGKVSKPEDGEAEIAVSGMRVER
jgi:uncharacterized protein (TIGR00156 family)